MCAMSTSAERAAIEVFWELHRGLTKQGPGSDASTRRALSLVPELPRAPEILDLGCGPGRQTLALARETGGRVTAVDRIPPFLSQLRESARIAGVEKRIQIFEGDMADLPYPDESFDLLWSEGAIYNIGFGHGLKTWRRLLRPGCAVAVSEATWLTDRPAKSVRRFWATHYPEMQSVEANERSARAAGYRLLGSFVLPESEWWDDYYTPIEARIRSLREHRDNENWTAALDIHEEEIRVIRDCRGSFGYVFFVLQKPRAIGSG